MLSGIHFVDKGLVFKFWRTFYQWKFTKFIPNLDVTQIYINDYDKIWFLIQYKKMNITVQYKENEQYKLFGPNLAH